MQIFINFNFAVVRRFDLNFAIMHLKSPKIKKKIKMFRTESLKILHFLDNYLYFIQIFKNLNFVSWNFHMNCLITQWNLKNGGKILIFFYFKTFSPLLPHFWSFGGLSDRFFYFQIIFGM
jgi:hypothetical protein